ncbi:hypothetical protein P8629_02685 [Hydrogenovibrio sp. 3SP14C1]|uniref:hypothetical protein n=1 Tax=Hydrogenovibrio sp. 3SP14C1 TaxID=3038774 RepID=UPI002416C5C0|nr:hypothetical protein [Hydrogenovibrio sp. 3SP14C1]MDG4811903.1 hypothetical protein [Hydrogenovibrio sp. 3SP14C1]
MRTLKSNMALKKEVKQLQKQLEQQDITIALLRNAELERSTEFVNQMQLIFGLVDYLFYDAEEIRTLGEAQKRWEEFKQTVNESESAAKALEALNLEIEISHGENQQIVMNSWSQSRQMT